MKKSRLLYLITLLAVLTTVAFAATGCNNRETSPVASAKGVVLYDFENYINDFAPIDIIGKFGKVNINDDEKFVHDGEFSAKLEPITGGVESLGRSFTPIPTLRLPMSLIRKGINETDFTYTESVDMYLYNDSDANQELTLYLGNSAGETTNVQVFTLYPRQWNEVSYRVNRAVEDYFVELRNVTYMYLKLPAGYVPENAPSIYLDTITIVKTDTEFERHRLVRKENEFATFDSLDQIGFLQQYNTTKNDFFDTRWSINTNTNYSKSGFSLKLDFKGVPSGMDVNAQYAGFVMKKQLFDGSGFYEMADNDKFCFDVYNPRKTDFTLLVVFCEGTAQIFRDLGQTTVLKPGWNHLEWTAAQIKKGADGFFTGKGCSSLADIDTLQLSYSIGRLAEGNYTLYFDDFMIQKAQ